MEQQNNIKDISHVSYKSHNNSRQMLLQILVDVVYLVVIM